MPVTGEARLGRRLVEQVQGLGFPRSPGGRSRGLELARSARASARRNRRLSARVASSPPPPTDRNRSIASSRAAIASWRGLGSPGFRAPKATSFGHRPAKDSRLKPHLPLRGGRGLLARTSRAVRSPAPSAGAGLRVGRGLGRPVERGGHLEHQLFAAGEIDGEFSIWSRTVVRCRSSSSSVAGCCADAAAARVARQQPATAMSHALWPSALQEGIAHTSVRLSSLTAGRKA